MALPLMFVALYAFENNIKRLETAKEEQLRVGTTSNRIGKWIYYLEFMNQDINNYLLGAQNGIKIHGNYRAAHNFYVQVLYETGIILLGVFLWILFKIYKERKKYMFNIDYIFFPLILNLITVSALGPVIIFLIPFSIITNKTKHQIIKLSFQ